MENQISKNMARRAWNFLRQQGQPLFGVSKSGVADTVQEVSRGVVRYKDTEYPVRSLPDHVREILRDSRERFLKYWR